MGRLLFIVAAWLCGSAAMAQVSVFSPRADSTSITIYRDGIALITETRTVELPAEAVTVVFQGVVDSLLPQSAVMTGAERPFATTDFSFDPLTPATLLNRSVGKTVTLVRTNRKSGKVTRTEVKIVSAGNGVVLQALDGSEALHCAGTPEYLELSEVPSELNAKPVLSARLAAGAPGKREVKLSYLAHGFSWTSDYVARLNNAANRMELTGWVTLENRTRSSFNQVQVQVVAGSLNLLSSHEGGSAVYGDPAAARAAGAENQASLLSQCFPLGTTTTGLPSGLRARERQRTFAYDAVSPMTVVTDLEEVTLTGARIMRENLGDYQLYRLPWLTDLGAQQTKQVVFLSKPAVEVERFYSVRVPGFDADRVWPDGVPNLMLRWENNEKEGLGEPLPSGTVRVFEPREKNAEVFAGEASIVDTPVGLPNELAIARAMNLASEYTLESEDSKRSNGLRQITVQVRHRFVNNKDAPVSIEVRHAGPGAYSSPVVVKSSRRAGKKYGDLAWRFVIPPGGEEALTYELRATEVP
jgi:hypothetical protein